MLKRLLLSLLVGLFLVSAANAQMKPLEFEKFELDNGLTVLLHQNNSAPVVTINVLYHVGSKNEKSGRSGFAHFFEHLMFEGSKYIKRGEFDKYLSAVGGNNNAYTTFDRTLYYENLPSNQLELGLWLESERMLHAKVDIEGVETQREVVKEERRSRYENQPYGRWQEEIFKRVMKGTPYETTPIGTMGDLNAAEEADFTEFYADFYRPDNAVLSIVGDIDIAKTKKLVKKYFASIPSPKEPIFRPEIQMPKLSGEMRDTFYDNNIQLPALFIAYPSPKQYSKDYYAMEMLNTILAGGQSSRIYKSLVDEKKVALQAASFQFPMEDVGMNVVLGIVNMNASLEDMELAIDEEIEKVKNNLISEREFQKIKNQQESSFIFNFSTNAGIAENLAIYETYQGDPNLINTEIERYLAVTPEDIKRVANKYLNKENRLVLFWLPGTGE